MSFDRRKVRIGRVVSDKMALTVVVEVERRGMHRLYGKVVRRRSRLKAHDPDSQATAGDLVQVIESRPLSKTKRWRVVRVLEKGQSVDAPPAETDFGPDDRRPAERMTTGAEPSTAKPSSGDDGAGESEAPERAVGDQGAAAEEKSQPTAEPQPSAEPSDDDGAGESEAPERAVGDQGTAAEEESQPTAEPQPSAEPSDDDGAGESETPERAMGDQGAATEEESQPTAEPQPSAESSDDDGAGESEAPERAVGDQGAAAEEESQPTAEPQPSAEPSDDGSKEPETAGLQPITEGEPQKAAQPSDAQPSRDGGSSDPGTEEPSSSAPTSDTGEEPPPTAERQPDSQPSGGDGSGGPSTGTGAGKTVNPFVRLFHEAQTVHPTAASEKPVVLPTGGPDTATSAEAHGQQSRDLARTEDPVIKNVATTELGPESQALADEFRDMVKGDYGRRCQICSRTFVTAAGSWQTNVIHAVPPSTDPRTNHFGNFLGLCPWHAALIQHGQWAFVNPDTGQPFDDTGTLEDWQAMRDFILAREPAVDLLGNEYVGLKVRFSNVYQDWKAEPADVDEEIRYSRPHWTYLTELLKS